MKLIYALLFVLFVLNSCTKNSDSNTYNFRGIVIDYSTGQRVSNANVLFTFRNANGRDSLSEYYASTVSNGNGEYSLSLENNWPGYYYRISGKKLNYSSFYLICDNRAGRSLNMSSIPYFDTVFVDKSTIVNLNISNVSPSNVNDTLELSLSQGKICFGSGGATLGAYNSKDLKLIGVINNHALSDTFSFKATPSTYVSWRVKSNGVITEGYQSFNPTEFGVNNYNINY